MLKLYKIAVSEHLTSKLVTGIDNTNMYMWEQPCIHLNHYAHIPMPSHKHTFKSHNFTELYEHTDSQGTYMFPHTRHAHIRAHERRV